MEMLHNNTYVTCPSDMAVEGGGTEILACMKHWLGIVDRGGLF